MIEIIKKGTKKRITCRACGAVLSYDKETDVQKRPYKMFIRNEYCTVAQEYIECPCCDEDVILNSPK